MVVSQFLSRLVRPLVLSAHVNTLSKYSDEVQGIFRLKKPYIYTLQFMLQVNQELMRPSSMLPYLNHIYETATVHPPPPPPSPTHRFAALRPAQNLRLVSQTMKLRS